jgi:hypothetical protein
MKILILIVALCALPLGMLLAQQEAAVSEPGAETVPDPKQAGSTTSGSGQSKPASGDRFKPSERIRADSPVSFPVDI